MACSRKGSTLVDKSVHDQVLHVGNKDEPATLDPHLNNSSTTNLLLGSMFEGLVDLANDGKTILPGVAERWEISDDGRTYLFHLRETARWSNGDPLTATAFRDSYLRLIDPVLGSERSSLAFVIVGAREFLERRSNDPASVGLRVVDDHTLEMRLNHPAPYWLAMIAQGPFFPLHRPSVDAAGGWTNRSASLTTGGKLVSNGAFKLAEWRSNAFVRVIRNEHYWDAARVRLKEIRFYPTDNETSEERTYRAGQLHVTYRLPTNKIALYERERAAELCITPQLRSEFLTYNLAASPFTDVRLRRAFSLAVDREQLVRITLGKLAAPADTLVRPGTGGYFTPHLKRFDPTEARRLLAECGYAGGAGFPKVEFTLNGNAGRQLLVGEALQQMWAEQLGIRVELKPVEFTMYLTLNRTKAFQLLLDGWGYSLDDPRDLLQVSTSYDPNNSAGWVNLTYDRAFEASDMTGDPAERQVAFSAMESLMAQEVPYAPLFYPNQGYLVHPTVRGWRTNGLRAIDWRELWLEAPP
ncbi:MAG: peptide ABC transporter substrate-binding protein [Opitutus sp.]